MQALQRAACHENPSPDSGRLLWSAVASLRLESHALRRSAAQARPLRRPGRCGMLGQAWLVGVVYLHSTRSASGRRFTALKIQWHT